MNKCRKIRDTEISEENIEDKNDIGNLGAKFYRCTTFEKHINKEFKVDTWY